MESRAERLETAGTIAGQVAHDFNNLLAPLVVYPEFIRDELPVDHPAKTYLDRIEEAAQKMAHINQDLLTMGRRGHYNQKIINLNSIVKQTISGLKPFPFSLAIDEKLEPNLMNFMGGSAQIYRAIFNLLNNAKESMHDDGRILVRTENYYVDNISLAYDCIPRGEYIKLTISDTGHGISDDIVQKIFDPFFTTKSTSRKRGSGLGLSVVDAVIRDHKGYIDLNSKIDEGTSFYIYLPAVRESLEGQESDLTSGGDEKILVVDDDEIQREVSSKLLLKLGYKVSTVESGEEAIEFVKKKPQDLLILDMVMPAGMDGTETYRQILRINPSQKAIIVSGFSESDRVLVVQKMGAKQFIKKPFTAEIMATAIRNELDIK